MQSYDYTVFLFAMILLMPWTKNICACFMMSMAEKVVLVTNFCEQEHIQNQNCFPVQVCMGFLCQLPSFLLTQIHLNDLITQRLTTGGTSEKRV